MSTQNRPFEVQPRANGAMAAVLQRTTLLALVLGVVGAIAPDPVGTTAGVLAVATVAAVPLGRVAWLAIRWVERRDCRFALTAVALLAVVASGAAIALLRAA